MTWPHPLEHEESLQAFLVERYVSPLAAVGLAASSARLARLCAGPDLTGTRVRHLYSVYLPTEDTCFCLLRAPSAEAVRAVNTQADFALDRIIDAVLLS
jgi:hypothetical protein